MCLFPWIKISVVPNLRNVHIGGNNARTHTYYLFIIGVQLVQADDLYMGITAS
jgi:hypothetical protein